MSPESIEPRFVEFIPSTLDDGVLYVSMEYSTASHRCVCGCGKRVVTPLGAADWVLTYDGTVTLSPSVGNGQLACGSHYVIRQNEIRWHRPMTRSSAQRVHAADNVQRAKAYGHPNRISPWARASQWFKGWLRSWAHTQRRT